MAVLFQEPDTRRPSPPKAKSSARRVHITTNNITTSTPSTPSNPPSTPLGHSPRLSSLSPSPIPRRSPTSPRSPHPATSPAMQHFPVMSPPPVTPVQARMPEQQLSILFVDPSNQLRSIIAQAYAEMVRHRFLNAYGRAPFNCIDSAGLYVPSNLTANSHEYAAGQLPDQVGLDVLLGHHPLSKDLQDIKNRLTRHRSRGVTARDFVKYDYIFCFDQENLARLQQLHARALRTLDATRPVRTVHIRLLGSYWPNKPMEIFSPRHSRDRRHSLSESAYYNCVRDIKTSFKQFARLHSGDDAYPTTSSMDWHTPFASRQLLAPNARITPDVLETLSTLYKCNLHADHPTTGSDSCVVTVAAEPHQIWSAFEATKDAFLRPLEPTGHPNPFLDPAGGQWGRPL